MKIASFLLPLFLMSSLALGVRPDLKNLPIGLAPHEIGRANGDAPITAPPSGPIRSLGEWETSDSAITLWPNPSFIQALTMRHHTTLLGDTSEDRGWWQQWLSSHDISDERVKVLAIPTDSLWVRDYGPWYILDGSGTLAMVDTKYNRPRPKDDVVPGHLARVLGVRMYQPGLVHTGGNYYADGLGNAFSSTLVYRENGGISSAEVLRRMHDFLGIEKYTTAKLNPGITIEHMDTYGKLVAPDTWVFSEFPQGSRYRADSEAMVALLKTLKSPYGTPYKIFRMKMVDEGGGENYHAYINSFISDGALYYPTYGVAADEEAKRVYQAALPAYEIVGVDGEGTEWGDSVHCRANNLYSAKTVFVFPTVSQPSLGKPTEVVAEIYPSPGANLAGAPKLTWFLNGIAQGEIAMEATTGRYYRAGLPAQSSQSKISFYITAKDSAGYTKTAPIRAPGMTIDFEVK